MDVGYGLASSSYLGWLLSLHLVDIRTISGNEVIRRGYCSHSIYSDLVEAP